MVLHIIASEEKKLTDDLNAVPMKRILITGAAGFLGSHLCDRFIKESFSVLGMDNLITGDLKNIEHLFKLKVKHKSAFNPSNVYRIQMRSLYKFMHIDLNIFFSQHEIETKSV